MSVSGAVLAATDVRVAWRSCWSTVRCVPGPRGRWQVRLAGL